MEVVSSHSFLLGYIYMELKNVYALNGCIKYLHTWEQEDARITQCYQQKMVSAVDFSNKKNHFIWFSG